MNKTKLKKSVSLLNKSQILQNKLWLIVQKNYLTPSRREISQKMSHL